MPDVVKPALHGRDHCPGGEDPIPCFPAVAWAALWDDFVWGEYLDEGDGPLTLTWPSGAVSTNSTGIFVLDVDTAPTPDSYTLYLAASGVYTFSLNVYHDANVTGYSIEWSISGPTYAAIRWPGQMSGDWGLNFITHFSGVGATAFTSFDSHIMHSATLPIDIDDPEPQLLTVEAQIVNSHPAATTASFGLMRKRLWVTYHGPLYGDQDDWNV